MFVYKKAGVPGLTRAPRRRVRTVDAAPRRAANAGAGAPGELKPGSLLAPIAGGLNPEEQQFDKASAVRVTGRAARSTGEPVGERSAESPTGGRRTRDRPQAPREKGPASEFTSVPSGTPVGGYFTTDRTPEELAEHQRQSWLEVT
jgi:hypothetical protein